MRSGCLGFSQRFCFRSSLAWYSSTSRYIDPCLLLVAVVGQRVEGEPVQPAEEAVPWLRLEIEDPAHCPVVLPGCLLKVDPRHLPLGKVDGPDVGNPSLFTPVHPHLLADHQTVGVVVQYDVRGRGSSQSGLAQPPSCQLGVIRGLV